MVICSCGSNNCTLIKNYTRKKGAKTGLGYGALGGALIGLAGGPIGAIAGAAIGAAGGAVFGGEQDKSGRKIEGYKCNSCGKKFTVCPQCQKYLECSIVVSGGNKESYCKHCHNFISSEKLDTSGNSGRRNINPQATAKATSAYINAVRNNINNISSMMDDDD